MKYTNNQTKSETQVETVHTDITRNSGVSAGLLRINSGKNPVTN